MERRITTLEREKRYAEILVLTKGLIPTDCDSADMAQAIAAACVDQQQYTTAADWYIRSYSLDPSDEGLGMALDMLLATGQYDRADALLKADDVDTDGYYYCAGKCQMAFRQNTDHRVQMEALEAFMDIQEEESYMLRLAMLYVCNGREKEASRLCRKIRRLFINGKAVDYATTLQEQIQQEQGAAFVEGQPWYDDCVFAHLSFDPSAPVYEDAVISNPIPTEKEAPAQQLQVPRPGLKLPKVAKEDRIAPIIEECLKDVIGMQELRKSLNDVFNMMQVARKRIGAIRILKDNLRIYGPDGCGKTTAALAAATALKKLGIIGEGEPQVATYYSLVGVNAEETHANVERLFKEAQNSCVIVDNIHEFNDSGAYGLGMDAIDQIIKAYCAASERIPLIITGSPKESEALLASKKQLAEVFKLPEIHLGEYSIQELVSIATRLADEKNLILDDDACSLIESRMEQLVKQQDFKYSRDLEILIEKAVMRQSNRLAKMRRPSENEYYVLRAEDFDVADSTETVEELLQQLNQLTGLSAVKEQVHKIVKQMQVQKLRQKHGYAGPQGHGSLHMVFMGNAGTGKTTIARIIGKIYRRLDILPKGQFVECTRRDLVSQYVGTTSQKVSDKINEAMGGILFIDEAYTLCKDEHDTFGREAIETLLADIENHRDSLMVILAGYGPDMQKFMDQNQGLRSRIPTDIVFEDYSVEEMVEIFKMNVKNHGLILDVGLEDKIRELIDKRKRQKNFGNGRGVRNLFDEIVLNHDTRLGSMDPDLLSHNDFVILREADLPKTSRSEGNHRQYLDELFSMTGLAAVKDKVNRIVSTVEVNQAMREMGLQAQDFGTLHMVFKGNPGTGKTTVARLIGNIYRELGVLSTGHLVECGRSDLVGQYVGSTAPKVKAKVQEALGGILFIDEAYSLAKGGENDFGREAIDTLVADIENYRKDLMVIIAGYSEDMELFLSQNQGLRSRFSNEIFFEDYSVEELLSIFKSNLTAKNLTMDPSLDSLAYQVICRHVTKADFGNARGVRNLLDQLCEQRNLRIAAMLRSGVHNKRDLQAVLEQDLQALL